MIRRVNVDSRRQNTAITNWNYYINLNLVGQDSTINAKFSSPEISIISAMKYLPLVKTKSFLLQKYVQEQCSIKEIAALTFSSRQTVKKYLEHFSIPLQQEDERAAGPLPFGQRWYRGRATQNKQEQEVIQKMRGLRERGHSYEKIAGILNTMGVKTQKRGGKWYGNSVYRAVKERKSN